ncbi:MAG: branched-chain amino acid aminotransferase, partial [Rhodospirillales bacterium]|nr:branched-chain amino acid aminotransferase [Rhodospirillales bacterium]
MNPNSKTPDRPEFAVHNGHVVPFSDAKISIMAPGLTFAAAVFEGLRAYWNPEQEQLYVFQMAEHLERLRYSMRVLEFENPPSSDEFASQIIAGLRANKCR